MTNNLGPYFHFLRNNNISNTSSWSLVRGSLTKKGGMGMCGPEDPPFHASPVVRKGPISTKSVSSKDPLLRKFRDFSFYSLNFCSTFSFQASKFGNFFSSQASKFGNFWSTSPQFGNFQFTSPFPVRGKYQFANPTLRKSGPHTSTWKKVNPPPRSFGHPNVRAVKSLSSNYCARKGVIKDHRTVFFFFFTESLWKKNGDNAMLISHIVKNKPQTGLFSEISSNLGWKHEVPQFVWMNFKK